MKLSKTKSPSQRVNSFSVEQAVLLPNKIIIRPVVISGNDMLVKPQQYEDKPEWGEVIAVGSDIAELSHGDVVYFQKYSSMKLRHNGEDYLIIYAEDVFFKLP